MTIRRRELLEGTGIALASLILPTTLIGCDDPADAPDGCDPVDHPLPSDLPVYEYGGPQGPATLFEHGVASGDPATDRVILWTRVSPSDSPASVEVFYEVALDTAFTRRVAAGTTTTSAERDFTVKLDPTGLRPATTYYFRFKALGVTSPTGRTRTAPEGSVAHLRLGMMSCSSYAHGYFHAYASMAERDDLDAVVHLGDYLYEYETDGYGDVRAYDPPHECLTLDDYRRRFRQYRKDIHLQAVHRQHPFICVWDDHEIADDGYDGGAGNHDASEGPYADRREAARRAYFEYQPIRTEFDGAVQRTIRFGELLDLVMLDTRHHGRSKQRENSTPDTADRTVLGFDQEAWLESQLASSTSRWVMLGQQIMVAQFSLAGSPTSTPNLDQWDGYAMARERLFQAIETHAAGRTVILTGDIHSSWAADIAREPWNPEVYDPATGAGALAVEFVTPGVTSPGLSSGSSGDDFFASLVLEGSPHMKLGDFVHRGYVVLDVNRSRIQADWFHLDKVEDPAGATVSFGFAASVEHGRPRIRVMDRATAPKRRSCELAP